MKRVFCFLCLLLAILGTVGCGQTDPYEDPVVFYYPRSEFGIGAADSVISQEIREGSGLSLDELLESYLEGPQEPELLNPFPQGTKLVSASLDADTLHITLSDSFASLSGIELTLASTAIAKTCMELTGAAAVELRAETELLNGNAFIVMNGTTVLVDEGAQYTQTSMPN